VVGRLARAGEDRFGFAPGAGQVSGSEALPGALDACRSGRAGHQVLASNAAG
jgi:hypothetical protein